MTLDRLAELSPVTRIGLGLAAVGRPGYINLGRERDFPPDRSVNELRTRTQELLTSAYASGVRYFDAARSYGRAEEFLASWLAKNPSAAVVVGSKWGYTYTGNWRVDADVHEVKDHSLATFNRQVTESQALFGARLDLYQIHSLTPQSPALADTALHERLAALGAEGVTIGFSTSGPQQAETIFAALEISVAGQPLFRSVQSTYNVLEPSAAPALAAARAAGLSVIVKEAMANGRLAQHPVLRHIGDTAGLADAADAVALAAVLHQPWVDIALSGAATAPQLDSNLRAESLTLTDAHLAQLDDLVEEPESYWAQRSALPWH